MVFRHEKRSPPVRRLQNAERAIATLAIIAATSIFADFPAARAEACPTTGDTPATLAAVAPRLELRLADGRLVRLAGLQAAAGTPTAPDRGKAAATALQAMLAGRAISVTMLSPRPDRWGRLAALASAADGPAAGREGGIAAAAIAAGLGRYVPDPAAAPCRSALLAAEDAARRGKLGLWSDPYYSVLATSDRTAFAARAGTDIVAEGRLVRVEPGSYRTRLRFAASDPEAQGARQLEATIVPRAMKQFEAQGVDFTSLIGRTLRLRGLLDRRFGPQIELAGPDQIEVLPAPDAPAPSRPN